MGLGGSKRSGESGEKNILKNNNKEWDACL